MKDKVIRLNGNYVTVNGKEYKKPSKRKLKVNEKGIYCGIYELLNDGWYITYNSLKQSLK